MTLKNSTRFRYCDGKTSADVPHGPAARCIRIGALSHEAPFVDQTFARRKFVELYVNQLRQSASMHQQRGSERSSTATAARGKRPKPMSAIKYPVAPA